MATPQTKKKGSKDAQTPTTTYESGGFIRTALVIGQARDGDTCGSIDILTPEGVRVGQLNIFVTDKDETFMVDVIDVEARFKSKRAIVFHAQEEDPVPEVKQGKSRTDINNVTHLVASHFTNKGD